MSKKYPISAASLVTRDTDKMGAKTGNIYKSVSIISKRASQIAVKMKEELSGKLSDFATTQDNLEEVFENKEQIEISRFYERLPKPASIATEEFLDDKLSYRNRSEEE